MHGVCEDAGCRGSFAETTGAGSGAVRPREKLLISRLRLAGGATATAAHEEEGAASQNNHGRDYG